MIDNTSKYITNLANIANDKSIDNIQKFVDALKPIVTTS